MKTNPPVQESPPDMGEPKVIRVLIADDHPLYRQGLKLALRRAGIKVVGEAATGDEAVAKATALEPDVALMDVRMPGMDGLHALKVLKARMPRLTVLILTNYESVDYLWSAVLGGAAGYLLKSSSGSEIVHTIRLAADGESVLDPKQLSEMLKLFAKESPVEGTGGQAVVPNLTVRENQVLAALADGLKNAQIARKFGLQEATVKAHLNHLFQKIHVADRTQAVLWATRQGLLPALHAMDPTSKRPPST